MPRFERSRSFLLPALAPVSLVALVVAPLSFIGCGGSGDSAVGAANQELITSCRAPLRLCSCGCGATCVANTIQGSSQCVSYCRELNCGLPPPPPPPPPSPPDMTVGLPGSATANAVCPAAAAEQFSFPADIPHSAPAVAGATPGSFSVSDSGTAQYNIPLTLAPGRAGMAPSLSVSYDSAARLGIMGKGFTVSGLSSIERCGSTLAQDKTSQGVHYNADDHFCLDGLRLVPITSITGATTEYRTWPDTFRKIISTNVTSGNSISSTPSLFGPTNFVVYEASGNVSTYATSIYVGQNQRTGSWLLTTVADRRGNTITYGYGQTTDTYGNVTEYWPQEIDYTSNSGLGGGTVLPASNSVVFNYVPADGRQPLNTTGYRGGTTVNRTHLLSSINLQNGGATYRQYQFNYHNSVVTNWPLLDTVTECAGGVCKPPTTFTWDEIPQQYPLMTSRAGYTPPGLPPINDYAGGATRTQYLNADVNGDGLSDLIVSTTDLADATKDDWFVALNQPGGNYRPFTQWASFTSPQWYPVIHQVGWPYSTPQQGAEGNVYQITPMDVDQDGNMDLMLYLPNGLFQPTGAAATFHYLKSVPPTFDSQGNLLTQGSFVLTDTGIPQPWLSDQSAAYMKPSNLTFDFFNQFRMGDINGDGVADLIECIDPNAGSAGSGTVPFPYCAPSMNCNPGDICGGNGAPECVGQGNWRIYPWTTNGGPGGTPGYSNSNILFPPWGLTPCSYAKGMLSIVDIDGDGKAEIMAPYQQGIVQTSFDHLGFDATGKPSVFLGGLPTSNGSIGTYSFNTLDQKWHVFDTHLPIHVAGYLPPVFADVNGDGYVDYVYPWGFESYVQQNAPNMMTALMAVKQFPTANPFSKYNWGDLGTWNPANWSGSGPPDVPYVNFNRGDRTFSDAVPLSINSAGPYNPTPIYPIQNGGDPNHRSWGISNFDSATAFDYNGDGVMDLMLPAPGAVSNELEGSNGAVFGSMSGQGWTLAPNAFNQDGLSSSYWVVYTGSPQIAVPVPGGPTGWQTWSATNIPQPQQGPNPFQDFDEFTINPTFFAPQIVDIDGDGQNDLYFASQTTIGALNPYFTNGPKDRLLTVNDGSNVFAPGDLNYKPTVTIDYGNLVDSTKTNGGAESQPDNILYWSNTNQNCFYPLKCFAQTMPVVKDYYLADGQGGQRLFVMNYRDGRYDMKGRGWLGFGEIMTRELTNFTTFDALPVSSGTVRLFDNHTMDAGNLNYPYAGRPTETIAWTTNLPGSTIADPNQVELSYQYDVPTEIIDNNGLSYYVTSAQTEQIKAEGTFANSNWPWGYRAYALGGEPNHPTSGPPSPLTILMDKKWTLNQLDPAWGNVLQATTTAMGVDLVGVTSATFNNDAPSWIIKRPNFTQTCSTSYNHELCPKKVIGYSSFGEPQDVAESDAASNDVQVVVSRHYNFDSYGNVAQINDRDYYGNTRSSCISYDSTATFPYATGNGLDQIAHTKYDPAFGVLNAVVDANKLITQYGYDGFGRRVFTQQPDGSTITTTIARSTASPFSTTITTQSPGNGWSSVKLDGDGRVVQSRTAGAQVPSCSNSGYCSSTPIYNEDRQYDIFGRLTQSSLPYLDGDALGNREFITYQYDGSGREVSRVSPWEAVTQKYLGPITLHTDSVGLTTTTLDTLGRTLSVSEPNANQPGGGSATTFTYGPLNQVWVATHGSDQTFFTLDAAGRVRQLVDPNSGGSTRSFDGFGEVTATLDADGRSSQRFYDVLGRIYKRVDQEGTTTWSYDTAPLGTGQVALGVLASVENGNSARSYTYTQLGQPRSTTLNVGADSFSSTLSYDNQGRVSSLSYPQIAGLAPLAITYTYDSYGFPIKVSDTNTTLIYWTLGGTNGWGAPTLESFAGGVYRQTGYDPLQRVVNHLQTGTSPAKFFQDLSYTYDAHFNMLSRTDASPDAGTQPQVEHFGYDTNDRLICSSIDHSVPTSKGPPSSCSSWVNYLNSGNIGVKADLGIVSTYGYDSAHPHAIFSVTTNGNEVTYQNDNVGNQKTRPDATILYTSFDLPASYTRLSDGTLIKLQYDGLQQRVRKSDPKSETTYFDGLYQRERDLTGVQADRSSYFVKLGSASLELTRQLGYPDDYAFSYPDVLGSSDVIAGLAGNVIEHRSYDAWGQQRNKQWSSTAPVPLTSFYTPGFTDQDYEESLDLVNMKGRIYDPKLGRMLQSDPIIGAAASAQRWNGYSYVRNNPLKLVDPTGFEDVYASAMVLTDTEGKTPPINPNSVGGSERFTSDNGKTGTVTIGALQVNPKDNELSDSTDAKPEAAPAVQTTPISCDPGNFNAVVGIINQTKGGTGDTPDDIREEYYSMTGDLRMYLLSSTHLWDQLMNYWMFDQAMAGTYAGPEWGDLARIPVPHADHVEAKANVDFGKPGSGITIQNIDSSAKTLNGHGSIRTYVPHWEMPEKTYLRVWAPPGFGIPVGPDAILNQGGGSWNINPWRVYGPGDMVPEFVLHPFPSMVGGIQVSGGPVPARTILKLAGPGLYDWSACSVYEPARGQYTPSLGFASPEGWFSKEDNDWIEPYH